MQPDLLTRLKESRLARVLVLYLGASWVMLEVTATLKELLDLPAWIGPVTVVLLAVGLVVVVATALVQADPRTDAREESGEVPDDWQLGMKELLGSLGRGHLPHLNWARVLVGGLVAFSLLFGAAGAWVLFSGDAGAGSRDATAGGEAGTGVAVLPFQATGEGMEVWREGMVDVLSTNLDGVGSLRGIDSRTVLDRWQDGAVAPQEVARAAGARFAVTGSAVGTGGNVRFTASVADLATGDQLGPVRAEGPADSILPVLDRLTVGLATTMLGQGQEAGGIRLAAITTASPAALQDYLRGEALYRGSDFEAATTAYERAVARDSTFALASARLAEVYGWAAGLNDALAVEAMERALRWAHRLPARDALLLELSSDLTRADMRSPQRVEEAVRRYPDDPAAWQEASEILFHFQHELLASRSEVERALTRAVELSPESGPAYIHLVEFLITHGDSARAAARMGQERSLGAASRFLPGHELAFRLAFGDSVAVAGVLRGLDTIPYTVLTTVPNALPAAQSTPLVTRILTEMSGRPEADPVRDPGMLAMSLLAGGRSADAEQAVAGTGPAAPFMAALNAALRPPLEMPPVDHAEPLTEFVPMELGGSAGIFIPAAAAAVRGDRALAEAGVTRLRSAAAAMDSAGETLEASRTRGAARALVGLLLQRSGASDAAADTLAAAQREAIGVDAWIPVNQLIRLWTATALMEAGRSGEAARYYESLGFLPYARYRLGQIEERAGNPEAALANYQAALQGWVEADPGYAPVEEARQAVLRLRAG